MAIKKARKETKKPALANASGGSVSMAEMQPPHGASRIQPPPPLPPGVYFSPTREECLGFLNQWSAGDTEMRDARGHISVADVYGEAPDALCRRHPPASVRGPGEHTWWFLSQTRFQRQAAGGSASKRADRRGETGGQWRVENGKVNQLDADPADGSKNTFAYYADKNKKGKTPWLMQEITSAQDGGTGKPGVPALYRVYVTRKATDDQRRDIFGEEGVRFWPDGREKPVRAMAPEEYFEGVAALLSEGSVRGGAGQEYVHAPPPPPPLMAPSEGFLDYYYGQQQGQYVDQYVQQQQQGQYLGHFEQQDQCPDQYQQQGQYLGQVEQQDQYVDQYQRRDVFGEEGVRFWPGRKKPVQAMVPEEYFEGVAALLPERSVCGGASQEHVHAPPPPPPLVAPPEGFLDYYYGQQQRQYVDQYLQQQQQGQYLGQFGQQDQYLDQYQRRDIFGEEGVRFWPNGRKKPVRAMVLEECFEGAAALLPEGSVRRGAGQEHVHVPPPPPLLVAPPEGFLDYYYGQQQGQYVDQYLQQQQQQGQYLGHFEQQDQCPDQYQQQGQYLGQFQQQGQYLGQFQQQDQCLDQYQQQGQYLGQFQQQGQYLGQFQQQDQCLDQYQQQGHHLGQFEQQDQCLDQYQQQGHYLGQSEQQDHCLDQYQQQGQFSAVASPFSEMVDEQPVETAKGEEPNLGSLDDTVDEDDGFDEIHRLLETIP